MISRFFVQYTAVDIIVQAFSTISLYYTFTKSLPIKNVLRKTSGDGDKTLRSDSVWDLKAR